MPWRAATKVKCFYPLAAAIFSLTALYSDLSLAAWEIRPIATAGVQYQTNPRMRRENEDEATGTLLGARLPMSVFSDRTRLFIEPRLVYSFYAETDDEDLENQDKYLAGRINRQMARTNYGITGQISDVGLITSEFESASPESPSGGTGGTFFLNTTQKRWHVDPYWMFQFTPLNSMSLNAGYNDVTYSRTSVFSRFDYTNSYVSAAVEHVFNQQNKVSLSANASQFDAIEPNSGLENDSTTTGLSLNYSHAISGTMEVSTNLGWAKTTQEIKRQQYLLPIPAFMTSICIPRTEILPLPLCDPIITKSDATNFVGNLSLTKHTEKNQFDISIGQTVSPNSNGSEVVRRTLSGYMTSNFTERLSGKFGLLVFDQNDVGDLSTRERQYLRFETTLRWKFTRLWSIRGDYRFTYNDDISNLTGDQPSARNHLFFVGIVYSGDGWR